MTSKPLRWAARFLARRLPGLARPRERDWAEAMAQESEHIASDRAAAAFALGCAASLVEQRVSNFVLEETSMGDKNSSKTPDAYLALACGAAAMAAGITLMMVEGAPRSYIIVNALTGLAAILAFPFLAKGAAAVARHAAVAAALLGAIILATSLFGAAADGIARWVRLGPVTLQVSFLVLPPLVVLAARLRAAQAAPPILLAAAGLALQPDRAMAAALLAAVAVLAVKDSGRGWLALLGLCAAALVAAFIQPDPMPALPFMDQIIPAAFAAHPALGILIAIGMIMPLLPFAFSLRRSAGDRPDAAVLGALWLMAVIAAILGNFPSPLVGYGASPILGYAISFAFLTGLRLSAATDEEQDASPLKPNRTVPHVREMLEA